MWLRWFPSTAASSICAMAGLASQKQKLPIVVAAKQGALLWELCFLSFVSVGTQAGKAGNRSDLLDPKSSARSACQAQGTTYLQLVPPPVPRSTKRFASQKKRKGSITNSFNQKMIENKSHINPVYSIKPFWVAWSLASTSGVKMRRHRCIPSLSVDRGDHMEFSPVGHVLA